MQFKSHSFVVCLDKTLNSNSILYGSSLLLVSEYANVSQFNLVLVLEQCTFNNNTWALTQMNLG